MLSVTGFSILRSIVRINLSQRVQFCYGRMQDSFAIRTVQKL